MACIAFLSTVASLVGMHASVQDVVPRADFEAVLARAQSAEARLALLEQQLASLKRQHFGASSENADQLTMFGSADIELIEQEIRAEVPVAPKKTVIERQRVVLPKGLPEQRVEVDLPAAEKLAADGTPLKRIGEEVTVKLGFKPAAFFKKLIVRPKYADPREPEAGVRCAKLPVQLIDGSLLDASLAAHLLVSKYADHLPLFRIDEIYQRGGIAIPRSTLSDWVIALSEWLRPLVLRLRAALLT